MRSTAITVLVLALAAPAVAQPTAKAPVIPKAEADLIKGAALDYIESWYEGNAERMSRAVHPELVKRIIVSDPAGGTRIEQMGASKLISNVRAGGGTKTPRARQKKEISILDRFGNAAVVRIVATDWVDYLQLAKIDGRWQIVNVLWEPLPMPAKK